MESHDEMLVAYGDWQESETPEQARAADERACKSLNRWFWGIEGFLIFLSIVLFLCGRQVAWIITALACVAFLVARWAARVIDIDH